MDGVRISVRMALVDCWSCGAEFRIVPSIELVTPAAVAECCVADFTVFPQLLPAVQASLPADLQIGKLKSRFSKPWGRSYVSNGCYHCDALYGQHYEIHARYDQTVAAVFEPAETQDWERMAQALEEAEDGHLI